MHQTQDGAPLLVRELHQGDEAARRELLEAATRELRKAYRPRENGGPCGGKPSGILVAFKGDSLIGTAEYVRRADHLYVQGVAVHPDYRGQGVCRALLRATEQVAKKDALTTFTLCAIEETVNVLIFEKLGFCVTNRGVAPNHVSPEGGPVTQADMTRSIP